MIGRRGKRSQRWRPSTEGGGSVNLISMMDVLTVLLLFMLKSYVSGGEVMVPSPGIRLPSSTAELPPALSIVVAIDGDEVLVGGEHVASLKEVLATRALEIGPLSERLQIVRQQEDDVARLRGTKAEPVKVATIQGDRDIEFRVLQKVMYTLGRNGYEDISLAVLQRS